jgi:uncharacterized membrane protein YhaH (DUF805 family)
MNWYIKVLQNYATFNGRARRTEFWMFTLMNALFVICAIFIDNVTDLAFEDMPYGIVYVLYSLLVFIPSFALSVRRLHDVGKSGWMILAGLIPLFGAIWLIVLYCTDSEPTTNDYGPNPKE